jgi:hypothetical protein
MEAVAVLIACVPQDLKEVLALRAFKDFLDLKEPLVPKGFKGFREIRVHKDLAVQIPMLPPLSTYIVYWIRLFRQKALSSLKM